MGSPAKSGVTIPSAGSHFTDSSAAPSRVNSTPCDSTTTAIIPTSTSARLQRSLAKLGLTHSSLRFPVGDSCMWQANPPVHLITHHAHPIVLQVLVEVHLVLQLLLLVVVVLECILRLVLY